MCNDVTIRKSDEEEMEDAFITDALCFLARLVKQHNSLVEVSTTILNRLDANRDVRENGWLNTERDRLAELLTDEPLRRTARCMDSMVIDQVTASIETTGGGQ